MYLDVIYCINRNIVECKEINTGFSPVPLDVLIETLWNVKSDVPQL